MSVFGEFTTSLPFGQSNSDKVDRKFCTYQVHIWGRYKCENLEAPQFETEEATREIATDPPDPTVEICYRAHQTCHCQKYSVSRSSLGHANYEARREELAAYNTRT